MTLEIQNPQMAYFSGGNCDVGKKSKTRTLEQVWLTSAPTALAKTEAQWVGLARLLPKSSGKKKLP
jgi:hypothetical protein